jgi:hypothetical protein
MDYFLKMHSVVKMVFGNQSKIRETQQFDKSNVNILKFNNAVLPYLDE